MTAAQQPASEQAARCDVGFVFALGMEAGGLEDLLESPRVIRGEKLKVVTGALAGRNVALAITGIGPAAARRGTEALIFGHQPSVIISAGFSGGLHSDAKLGHVVLAEQIADAAGNRLDIELSIDRASARQPGLHIGRLLNTERLVGSPARKRALGEEHDALAVDLESLAVGQACREAGVPFLAVRIISDDVDAELPEFLDRYADQKSTAGRTGVVIGALFKKPGNLKSMVKLREDALVLSDKLARFLKSLVAELSAILPARHVESSDE